MVNPLLHIMLGLVNQFLKKIESLHGKSYTVDNVYKPMGFVLPRYHGGNLDFGLVIVVRSFGVVFALKFVKLHINLLSYSTKSHKPQFLKLLNSAIIMISIGHWTKFFTLYVLALTGVSLVAWKLSC